MMSALMVPRFFPFLVTADGELETLNASSTGTELLTPCLATGQCTGMVKGLVGAWGEDVEWAGPGGDADEEDIDSEARELRVVVAVSKPAALDVDASFSIE